MPASSVQRSRSVAKTKQVFISYAHEDEKLVKPLARGLEACGYLVWWDPEIRFGQGFRNTIAKALDEVDCVIVLWSRDSIKSTWVRAEAQKALDQKKLIPILLDNVKPPLPFGEFQMADFTAWEGSTSDKVFGKLVSEVREKAGPPLELAEENEVVELPAGNSGQERNKLVILFEHTDGDFLKKSGSTKASDFVKFLEVIARDLGLELWWDEDREHPRWNPQIEQIIDEAAVVVFVVSVDLLLSSYVMSLRAQRAFLRLGNAGVPMIAVRYKTIPGHPHAWLSGMPEVPKTGKPLLRRRDRLEVYKELTDLIQRKLRRRALPVRDARASRALRKAPPSEHSEAQWKRFRADACDEAFKYVPNPKMHERICAAARKLGAKEGGRPPLGKKLLAQLDARFLARKEKREPDPKKIRWVLRCYNLHPQSKVRQAAKAS